MVFVNGIQLAESQVHCFHEEDEDEDEAGERDGSANVRLADGTAHRDRPPMRGESKQLLNDTSSRLVLIKSKLDNLPMKKPVPQRVSSLRLFDGQPNNVHLDEVLDRSIEREETISRPFAAHLPRRSDKKYAADTNGRVAPLGIREEVSYIRQRIRDHSAGVLNPRSRMLARWDFITFALLIYTAFVTPFEVSFLNTKTKHELFWINRVVDLVFITDIFVQFNLAFVDETRGSMLIKSKKLIAQRYIHGWFTCDLVSVIPVDVLRVILPNGQKLENFKAFRLIRLLRLLKLLRVIRASRMLARYETEYAVSYAHMALAKHFTAIMIMSHWMACIWGMSLQVQSEEEWTWIRALELVKVDDEGKCLFDRNKAYDVYIRSLYFSIYILTGIGLGDITAQTNEETMLASFCMIVAAVFWAYTIGNFCSIVSVMDHSRHEFRQRMDELNHMLEDRKFPQELRQRCRMFFVQSKEQHRIENYRHIEKNFSSALRLEVAVANNGRWLKKVWYLSEAPSPFIAELSQLLVPATYAPMEVINLTFTLVILRRGIAARKGRVLAKGSVWGEDFVLENDDLVDNSYSAALTYVDVLYLRHSHFIHLASDFPAIVARINKAKVFYAIRARLAIMGRLCVQSKVHKAEVVKHMGSESKYPANLNDMHIETEDTSMGRRPLADDGSRFPTWTNRVKTSLARSPNHRSTSSSSKTPPEDEVRASAADYDARGRSPNHRSTSSSSKTPPEDKVGAAAEDDVGHRKVQQRQQQQQQQENDDDETDQNEPPPGDDDPPQLQPLGLLLLQRTAAFVQNNDGAASSTPSPTSSRGRLMSPPPCRTTVDPQALYLKSHLDRDGSHRTVEEVLQSARDSSTLTTGAALRDGGGGPVDARSREPHPEPPRPNRGTMRGAAAKIYSKP